jgi:hypothetical protein
MWPSAPGSPSCFFDEAGGARLPNTMLSEVFASEPIYPWRQMLTSEPPAEE